MMPKFFQKLVLSFLSFLILFFSVAPNFMSAHAAATWYDSGYFDWYNKVYNQGTSSPSEIFGERYTAAQVQWVLYGLLSVPLNQILSIQPGLDSCMFTLSTSSLTDMTKCGLALGLLGLKVTTGFGFALLLGENEDPNKSLATEMFSVDSRPLSGIKYVKQVSQRLSPVSSAKAQGFGYTQLDAVQQYWSGFRNMAYAIIVLITIIFAFMIMFRIKLNPQTVISVQSAIPKIFGAVILATFSYAIAGLLIDLMYVVAGLFASLLSMAGFAPSTVRAYNAIMPTIAGTATSFYIFAYMLSYAIMFLLAVIWAILSIFLGNLVFFGIFGTIVALLFIVLWLWVCVLMLWYTIKVPWVLLKNLISIYISIVVAPLQIVAGTLVPSIGFNQWLKKLIAELLVFPLTGLLMYLAWITLLHSFSVSPQATLLGDFLTTANSVAPPASLWAPEIIGSTASMSGLIWIAVSFTLITLIPKAIDIMKAAIMGERFAFGSALSDAQGAAIWARNQALRTTGIGDIYELGRQARTARLMEKYLAPDTRIGGWAERFVGGGSVRARQGINQAQEKYMRTTGQSDSVSGR